MSTRAHFTNTIPTNFAPLSSFGKDAARAPKARKTSLGKTATQASSENKGRHFIFALTVAASAIILAVLGAAKLFEMCT